MTSPITLTVGKPYDFHRSVRDHGWIALAPFRWLESEQAVQRVDRLDSGKVVLLRLRATDAGTAVTVHADVQTAPGVKLTAADKAEIRRKVYWMLKLDEDFSEFYALAASEPELHAKLSSGRGRLLRSPTLFEDVVKTIGTTNTTWSQTKGMIARIVSTLGSPYPGSAAPDGTDATELRAFPTPEQVVTGQERFASDIRLGYRNDYVITLAREIVEGQRDLEALKDSTLPIKELKRELKTIKGVGDYAAHTLLMILGRYDEVAVDSEVRAFVNRKYGGSLTDREMAALFERWGRWKYLAYWFENS